MGHLMVQVCGLVVCTGISNAVAGIQTQLVLKPIEEGCVGAFIFEIVQVNYGP